MLPAGSQRGKNKWSKLKAQLLHITNDVILAGISLISHVALEVANVLSEGVIRGSVLTMVLSPSIAILESCPLRLQYQVLLCNRVSGFVRPLSMVLVQIRLSDCLIWWLTHVWSYAARSLKHWSLVKNISGLSMLSNYTSILGLVGCGEAENLKDFRRHNLGSLSYYLSPCSMLC